MMPGRATRVEVTLAVAIAEAVTEEAVTVARYCSVCFPAEAWRGSSTKENHRTRTDGWAEDE
jgi:hypothetical protein